MKAKKSLGQHFLADSFYIDRILQLVPRNEDLQLIEIGPGMGALTPFLHQINSNLIAFEVDERAVEILKRDFPSIDVRHQDFLSTDLETLSAKNKIAAVGNIPYNITSPILFHLLDHYQYMDSAIIMMQKEVADRLVSEPGNKSYGILSVQTQILSSVTKMFDVPATAFRPAPKVASSVLHFKFDKTLDEVSLKSFKKVVRMAFNQRRKMLRNSLKSLIEAPEDLGENETKRPEALSPQEFVTLTKKLLG